MIKYIVIFSIVATLYGLYKTVVLTRENVRLKAYKQTLACAGCARPHVTSDLTSPSERWLDVYSPKHWALLRRRSGMSFSKWKEHSRSYTRCPECYWSIRCHEGDTMVTKQFVDRRSRLFRGE